jgi:predicted secreted protein
MKSLLTLESRLLSGSSNKKPSRVFLVTQFIRDLLIIYFMYKTTGIELESLPRFLTLL